MEIKFNGTIKEIPKSHTLIDLLEENNLHQATGIAVARNGQVISKNNWSLTDLQENDNIIVITATQGG